MMVQELDNWRQLQSNIIAFPPLPDWLVLSRIAEFESSAMETWKPNITDTWKVHAEYKN